ncbi:hypothetical protein P43SY_007441 [Pythium insidiosum]|uniref:holo-[acyl-carrier-protein] synthase n=1 Tax=Pythium insidiosum TaxID=114742 RepID=A0AAD5LWI8_PYTIN|nr:hypothetical protein P43SY_007441 [Pythium insidiosum]
MHEGVVAWYVDVRAWDPCSAAWRHALETLPIEEQQQVKRFVFAKDQRLALASRLLQRALVHEVFEVPWRDIAIARTPEGKPFWRRSTPRPEHPWWNYNVSHHGTVVAIAAHATRLVGVDVMQLLERPRGARPQDDPSTFFQAFRSHFTPREWRWIERSAEPAAQFHAFYRLWSLKESYIKAIGVGLGFELLRAEFSPRQSRDDAWELCLDGHSATHWQFRSSVVDQAAEDGGHVISVALGPMDEIWSPSTSSIVPHADLAALRESTGASEPGELLVTWQRKELRELLP